MAQRIERKSVIHCTFPPQKKDELPLFFVSPVLLRQSTRANTTWAVPIKTGSETPNETRGSFTKWVSVASCRLLPMSRTAQTRNRRRQMITSFSHRRLFFILSCFCHRRCRPTSVSSQSKRYERKRRKTYEWPSPAEERPHAGRSANRRTSQRGAKKM